MKKAYLFFSICVMIIFILSSCAPKTPVPTQSIALAAPTDTPMPEIVLPTATGEPAVAAPTAIVHTAIPRDPVYDANQLAADCNTGQRWATGTHPLISSGCDYWNRLWLERPADAMDGTIVPALDINWSEAGADSLWIYLELKVYNLSTRPEGYKAGFELDADLDSRGEFLLLANQFDSTEWTTDGVQVWQDENNDVGGSVPFSHDDSNGNGYERLLFDSGVGNDPDLAWVRIAPNDPNIIQFAFKPTLLPNPKVFGWWAWTGLGVLTPGKFELVDLDTSENVWNVDNSCSWIFGKTPVEGELANLCALVQPTPTLTLPPPVTKCEPPTGGCPRFTYWDQASCSCKFRLIILPTKTPIIIY